MNPEQQQAPTEAAGDLEIFADWLANNVWVSLGLAWVIIIISLTELAKRVWDLLLGADHAKRAAFLQLLPFVFGIITGPFLAPEIAATTPFASVGWMEGLLFGAVAGMGAIGAYEVARETRPLRMLKVMIRGMFRLAYETLTRKPLTEKDEAALDRTQKRPPVSLEDNDQ